MPPPASKGSESALDRIAGQVGRELEAIVAPAATRDAKIAPELRVLIASGNGSAEVQVWLTGAPSPDLLARLAKLGFKQTADSLVAKILIGQYNRAVSIAQRIATRMGGPLETIDFGGGLGTPYFAHETELDLNIVAEGIAAIDQRMQDDPLLSKTTAILEPGRFLVNESGIYISRVTRVKQSRGKTFAVIDGGMHHHLAASGNLGQTIKRNYPLSILNKIGMPSGDPIEIVGPLCTPLDTIGRGIELPPAEPGDLIGVFLSGAYARTSSPLGFLSHNSPAEVMVADGQATLIRRRGEPNDYLQDQID